MSNKIMTAARAASRFARASKALEEAKEALMPYAKEQAEITRKVIAARGLSDQYSHRAYFRYDWIELEVEGYYVGSSSIPAISCQLWERGRCGDSDSVEGSFVLSQHVINGHPEKFEAELYAKLETAAQKQAREKEEQRQRDIAHMEAELKRLRGGA